VDARDRGGIRRSCPAHGHAASLVRERPPGGAYRAVPTATPRRPTGSRTQARAELERWFETPLEHRSRPGDELAIKLAMALTTPGVDLRHVIQNSAPRRCARCAS